MFAKGKPMDRQKKRCRACSGKERGTGHRQEGIAEGEGRPHIVVRLLKGPSESGKEKRGPAYDRYKAPLSLQKQETVSLLLRHLLSSIPGQTDQSRAEEYGSAGHRYRGIGVDLLISTNCHIVEPKIISTGCCISERYCGEWTRKIIETKVEHAPARYVCTIGNSQRCAASA